MNRSRPSPLLLLLVAGCMPAPRIAAPQPTAPPPVLVPPPPAVIAWTDAPVTSGGWSYAREAAGSIARFGMPGAPDAFAMRCDPVARLVWLSRPDALAGIMTITTSSGARSWAASVLEGRLAVALPARDGFLDQIAFSRARFAVEGAGSPRLILPVWAEPTRVIEDCRG